MIKLATVFSGIGAIEHALKRMDIDHKLIFACDNGDVDILSKNIKDDINSIETEMTELKILLNDISNLSRENIDMVKQLNSCKKKLENELQNINNLDINIIKNNVIKILNKITLS